MFKLLLLGSLASLTVDLTLGLAKFESDSKRAEQAAFQLGEKIGQSVVGAGAAVAAFTATAATAAIGLLAFVDRSVKGTAELHALAEATGASASAIASFATASATSGVSLDRVASIVARLNVTLSKPIDETTGVGAALAAIGLSADQLRALKPDEQLELIAQKLSGFAEGAGRGAVATALLGKGAATALPFLNDLAESGRSQIILTDAQIDAADRYAKAQARSSSELAQLAQVAALQALPALSSFVEALKETAQAVVGVDATTKTLGTSTAVADFASTAVKALGFVVDAGDGVARTFGTVGKFIGGYAAVAAALLQGDLGLAKRIGAEARADIDGMLSAPLFSDRLAARLAASKIPLPPEAVKPALNFRLPDTRSTTKTVTASTSAYDGLVRSITAKISATEVELLGTEKLSASQAFALDIVTRLAASEGRFTAAQKRSATAALETYLASGGTLELRGQQMAATEALAKSTAASAAALDREADARLGSNQSLRDALVEYGLTGAQVERLRIGRLEDALATEQQVLAVGRARDLSDAEAAGLERNIGLLQEQIDLRKQAAAKVADDAADPFAGATRGIAAYLDATKNAGTATRSAVAGGLSVLEGDLTSSLARGKLSARSFFDYVQAEVLRLAVVRPFLQALFGDVAGKESGINPAITGLIDRLQRGGTATATITSGDFARFDRLPEGSTDPAPFNTFLATLTKNGTAAADNFGSAAAKLILSTDKTSAAFGGLPGLLGQFGNSVVSMLQSLAAGSGGSGGGIGGFIASLFGGGGGASGPTSGDFARLDRLPGLAVGTNYVPYDGFKASLHKGEAVVPAKYNPAAGGGFSGGSQGSRPVTLNVINNGAPVQAKSTQRETSEGTVIELVLDAVAADMAGGGKVHDATQRRFGLNPGGSTPRY